MATRSSLSQVPFTREPSILSDESLQSIGAEARLQKKARAAFLNLVDSFHSCWSSGAASASLSDRRERLSRLQSYMPVFKALQEELDEGSIDESIPLDLSCWLYGGVGLPRDRDLPYEARWDLPVLKALSRFLAVFSDS